jgi:hypothetical protein
MADSTEEKNEKKAQPDSAHVGGVEGPIDKDVVSPITGKSGDPTAGSDVAFVNKEGDIDGSAAPETEDKVTELLKAKTYVAALGFDFNSYGGTNSPPHRLLKGDKIAKDMISPQDLKVFVGLGYLKPA